MAEKRLNLVPQPKEVVAKEGVFRLNADTWIVLTPDAGDAEHDAARSLQCEIQEATGLRLPIVKTFEPVRDENLILLVSDPAAAVRHARFAVPWDEGLAAHGEQAYFVGTSPQRVVAGGRGALALHYAVQTLRQIVRLEHAEWPAVYIADWPSLQYRGLMLDVSRGKVPTIETLKRIVDELALFKINVLQLYTEHTFVFPHHPRIGQDCGSLSGDDMLALDAYARRRYVELIPNLQSFGHCAHILRVPEYEHLAESAARWSLCPVDEETYEFLGDLYADMLPAFTSSHFNVGCDETYDLGKGRSAEAAAERGTGRVYLEHILRLRELAKQHGRKIQIWGDILLHYPELVGELPDDVTLMDWHYEVEEDYPSVRLFAESGRSFWVCPGTSSWNTLFPRIENSNGNIRMLARLGAEYGALGLLNTDWGDHGHYQPLGQCWYGYAYGAEQAWSGGATEDADFDAAFGPLFFGASGGAVVAAIRELGRLNTLPGIPRPNATNTIYAFLDEPLLGEMVDEIPVETLHEIVESTDAVERDLRAALPGCRDRLSVEEMIYSTRAMNHAARKVLVSGNIRADLASGADDLAARMRRGAADLVALDAELVALREDFEAQWMRRARRSEISITLDYFDGLRSRYAAAREWLLEQAGRIDAGDATDADLGDYAQRLGRYEVLGQAFRREMHEAGIW
jgi:hexosaminidase